MIHYILLPIEERHALRREYRLRLAIAAFFFISCAIVIGMATLIPSYTYTLQQEEEALALEGALQKNREESGAQQIEKELIVSQTIAEKIISHQEPLVYSEAIEKIIFHRKSDLFLTSFSLTPVVATTTVGEMIVRGRTNTREALLDFKKKLEADPAFTDIELPLSDLTKSKNITFDMKLKIRRQ